MTEAADKKQVLVTMADHETEVVEADGFEIDALGTLQLYATVGPKNSWTPIVAYATGFWTVCRVRRRG